MQTMRAQLLIIGMHRSGTSAVAGLVHQMGAYVGPDYAMDRVTDGNPRGHWERIDVRKANMTVLSSLGHDWYRLEGFHLARVSEDVRAAFEAQARTVLEELETHRPWVIKDPRLCILLPLWERLLQSPLCIFIYRHPVEVAFSLQTRNGFPLGFGVALWEYYNLHALKNVARFPTLFVSHADMMRNPVGFAQRLFDALSGQGVPGLRPLEPGEVQAFIDRSLYTARSTPEREEGLMTWHQRRIVDCLEAKRREAPAEPIELSDASRTALEALGERALEVDRLQRQNEELASRLALREQALDHTRTMVGCFAEELLTGLRWLHQSWSWRVGHGLTKSLRYVLNRSDPASPPAYLAHIAHELNKLADGNGGFGRSTSET